MKRFNYIFLGTIVTVLLLAMLWMFGGRTFVNMVETTISASPENVFSYLTEPEQFKKWMDGLVDVKSLSTGGHRVGARSQLIVEEEGTRYILNSEVIRSDPGRLLEVRITTSAFEVTNVYELSQQNKATQLKQTMTARYRGFVRLFAPLLGNEAQRQLEADFARLKTTVET